MTSAAPVPAPRLRGIAHVTRWTLWSQRPRLIGYCLLIELAAVLLTVSGGLGQNEAHDARLCALLAGLGVAQAEISRQIERTRRSISETPHINMTSVWTFAAVLLLPPAYITAVVAALYAHSALRIWFGLRRVPAFRIIFNAALVVVVCLLARAALTGVGFPGMSTAIDRGWAGFVPIALCAVVYFAVGAVVSLPGLNLTNHAPADLFGSLMDNALEVSTLCLGALNAVILVAMPELSVAIIPPMLLLQRSMLVQQLEVAATTDEKTGVLNTAGWHHLAGQELTRAGRNRRASLGVLMIDLDHFKRINDTYGHLVGDQVLKAVAERIGGEVRDYDSVGRFGGEEFVVLLPGSSAAVSRTVAERIRAAISEVHVLTPSGARVDGLSASIGVAMYPTEGAAVDRLLAAADGALYRAKAEGRDRVVVSATA